MRLLKVTYLIATVLMLASGCSSKVDVQKEQVELTLQAFSTVRTKGYVESTTLYETAPTHLHDASGTSPRSIHLTSWLYPQSGADGEYFRNEVFTKSTDNLWHRGVPVYWPMEGRLDMMAYSSTVAFPESAVGYSNGTTTDELLLAIDRTYTQDDVLFSWVGNVTNGGGLSPTVPMLFKHAQAWIEFVFHCKNASFNNIIRVNQVVLTDIYTQGILHVAHPYDEAEAEWDFRFATRLDTVVDDNNGIYTTGVTTARTYLDMLIPEQPVKDIILYYNMEGGDPEMRYRYTMSGHHWEMGKKYVYDITFSPTAIEVDLSVTDWDSQTPAGIDVPE